MNTTSTIAPDVRAPWRRKVELVIPALGVAIAVAVPLIAWGRLPDSVASHWNAGGEPDGALPRAADLVLYAALMAALFLGALAVTRLRLPRGAARVHLGLLTGVSAMLAGVRLVTVRANLDASDWQDADQVTWSMLLVCLVIALAAGGLGSLLAGARPEMERTTARVQPVRAEPAQALVWAGHAGGKSMTFVPALLMAMAAVLGWFLPQPGGVVVLIVLPVVALLVATLSQARVTVGPRGVLIVFGWLGWLGWPRKLVPLAQIVDVTVEDLKPAAYGGWGVRQVRGAVAIVTRSGPALRIERQDNPAFVMTVDGAEDAAAVLAAHVARAEEAVADRTGEAQGLS